MISDPHWFILFWTLVLSPVLIFIGWVAYRSIKLVRSDIAQRRRTRAQNTPPPIMGNVYYESLQASHGRIIEQLKEYEQNKKELTAVFTKFLAAPIDVDSVSSFLQETRRLLNISDEEYVSLRAKRGVVNSLMELKEPTDNRLRKGMALYDEVR